MTVVTRNLKPFEYFEPKTIAEATQFLSTHGAKAKVLAGGVDLIFRMRRRQIQPEYIVSLQSIPGLDYIRKDGENLKIGALTNLRTIELSPIIREDYSILAEAIHTIASIQVKNMGTAVGNLCIATPASDVAPPLFALGAKLRLIGLSGERIVPIEEFYLNVGQTILQPDEIVAEILIPNSSAKVRGAFLKLVRTATDIAKVNVAVTLTIEDNICRDAKVAVGSVAPTVFRAKKAEGILIGEKLKPEVVEEAAEAAAEEAKPITDLRSTAEYRREMVKVLVRRAIGKAQERGN